MAIIERIPVISNPELIDRVIADIQKGLADNIGWLNYAFGRAQRLVKAINGKSYFTPNVYAGGNEYLEVSPDANIGNFCFFQIDDPQYMDWQPKIRGAIRCGYSLIFWHDLRTIPGTDGRNTEIVKAEVLKVLNGGFWLKSGRVNVTRIFEQAENIYRGYSLDEVDNQYLMHPYAGFRITGELYINESC